MNAEVGVLDVVTALELDRLDRFERYAETVGVIRRALSAEPTINEYAQAFAMIEATEIELFGRCFCDLSYGVAAIYQPGRCFGSSRLDTSPG